MEKSYPLFGLVLLSVAALSVFGGMQLQKRVLDGGENDRGFMMMGEDGASFTGGPMGRNGAGGTMRRSMGDMVSGEIISKDDTGITISLPDGGSRIIYVVDSTTVTEAEQKTVSDLAVGQAVMVTGSGGEGDVMTASSIAIGAGLMPTP